MLKLLIWIKLIQCLDFIKDNLMSMEEFIDNKYTRKNKKIPKKSKLESQYNNYKFETVIILSCNLLVYLQLELNDLWLHIVIVYQLFMDIL